MRVAPVPGVVHGAHTAGNDMPRTGAGGKQGAVRYGRILCSLTCAPLLLAGVELNGLAGLLLIMAAVVPVGVAAADVAVLARIRSAFRRGWRLP